MRIEREAQAKIQAELDKQAAAQALIDEEKRARDEEESKKVAAAAAAARKAAALAEAEEDRKVEAQMAAVLAGRGINRSEGVDAADAAAHAAFKEEQRLSKEREKAAASAGPLLRCPAQSTGAAPRPRTRRPSLPRSGSTKTARAPPVTPRWPCPLLLPPRRRAARLRRRSRSPRRDRPPTRARTRARLPSAFAHEGYCGRAIQGTLAREEHGTNAASAAAPAKTASRHAKTSSVVDSKTVAAAVSASAAASKSSAAGEKTLTLEEKKARPTYHAFEGCGAAGGIQQGPAAGAVRAGIHGRHASNGSTAGQSQGHHGAGSHEQIDAQRTIGWKVDDGKQQQRTPTGVAFVSVSPCFSLSLFFFSLPNLLATRSLDFVCSPVHRLLPPLPCSPVCWISFFLLFALLLLSLSSFLPVCFVSLDARKSHDAMDPSNTSCCGRYRSISMAGAGGRDRELEMKMSSFK